MEPERTVNTCSPTSRAPASSSASTTTSATSTVLTIFHTFFKVGFIFLLSFLAVRAGYGAR